VTVEDAAEDRAHVDAAHQTKYGHGAAVDRMTGDETAATTLRLRIALPRPGSSPDWPALA